MYTIMQILAIFGIIIAVAGAVIYYVFWCFTIDDNKSGFRANTEKAEYARKKRNSIPAALFFVGLLFISILTCIWTSKNLNEIKCDRSNGVWEEWDSGFMWECYNPNNIQSDNNLRIIHAEEE